MAQAPHRPVSTSTPPRACPICLADLVVEERGGSLVYRCKMCHAVEITVRSRPTDEGEAPLQRLDRYGPRLS